MPARGKGFTLIELLVVIGILIAITLVVLFNYRQFGSTILLENIAYDIGLSIRQAQTYGLSVRGVGDGTATFDTAYGVHFVAADTGHWSFFADKNRSGVYDACAGAGCDTILEGYTLKRGSTIKRFCATRTNAEEHCTDSSSSPLTTLDITFNRPNPDAIITSNVVSGITAFPYQKARITIQTPEGLERHIEIESTGQISVPQ